MANKSSSNLAGIALMVISPGVAYRGYDLLDSFGSQFSQAFSDSSSNAVLIRNIEGTSALPLVYFYL